MSDQKAKHTWGVEPSCAPARGSPHLPLFPELDSAPRVSARNQKYVHPTVGHAQIQKARWSVPKSNKQNPCNSDLECQRSGARKYQCPQGARPRCQSLTRPPAPEGWQRDGRPCRRGGTECLKHDSPNIPIDPRQDFLPLTLNTNITRY